MMLCYRMFMAMWMAMCLVPIATISPNSVLIRSVSPDDIVVYIPNHIIVYRDGRYEKLVGCDTTPAGVDPSSGVQSKDVVISPDAPLSARLYIPKPQNRLVKKLPLLFFYHGGGFICGTAAEPSTHNFLNLIAAESNAMIVSVDYRTVPDNRIPTAYDDSWEAIKWAAQHVDGNGPESWINEHADLGHVFFAGDSSGANIAHQMAIRAGSENMGGSINLEGIILLHPFFWGTTSVGSEDPNSDFIEYVEMLWTFDYPETSGLDDPFLNPAMDPKLSNLGGSKVLVYVAELDDLRTRGWYYKYILDQSGWKGKINVIEDKGVGHVYFLSDPSLESARAMRTNVSTFINT
ncbi:putative carboxylesterase [Helianthus annuus]|nr:putative carboxylesterase [Helianthus annuus]